jgi:hypothetical protein
MLMFSGAQNSKLFVFVSVMSQPVLSMSSRGLWQPMPRFFHVCPAPRGAK